MEEEFVGDSETNGTVSETKPSSMSDSGKNLSV